VAAVASVAPAALLRLLTLSDWLAGLRKWAGEVVDSPAFLRDCEGGRTTGAHATGTMMGVTALLPEGLGAELRRNEKG
jgi:hypothetical protein